MDELSDKPCSYCVPFILRFPWSTTLPQIPIIRVTYTVFYITPMYVDIVFTFPYDVVDRRNFGRDK